MAGNVDCDRRRHGGQDGCRPDKVSAHQALLREAYVRYASGRTEPFVDVDDIAGGSRLDQGREIPRRT